MRLNVYLQKAGVGSRREAERLVADERVTINGRIATATTPVGEKDVIEVDGKKVTPKHKPLPRLFRLYKPLDFLVTNVDPQGRATIYDLPVLNPPIWPKDMPRIMSVGRLDVNSEGLLLLSTDGPLAQALMSPETGMERVYRIRVHGRLTDKQIEKIERGVKVRGVEYRGAKIRMEKQPSGKNTWYQITLTEGKNREVRKMMEHFGCVVNRLIRIQYGPYHLKPLTRGSIHEVPRHQVEKLIKQLRKKGYDL
ncbi:MAG: pseudouridine synthase [Pseudomonadota bacterium]|nr:pseudouridine synthase [Pseudomonadota bacterium]